MRPPALVCAGDLALVLGCSGIDIDVDWVQVCFTAGPALLEDQRAEGARKGATPASSVGSPASWTDFPGVFDWRAAAWWPTDAAEVRVWEQGAGAGDDVGYGVMWTIDGDRTCVRSWSFQHWTP